MKIKFKIEISFAIALTVILLMLCVQKFLALKTQAHQGLTEKSFITLNDALSVYRGDNEGRCPEKLEDLIPFYMDKIPPFYNRKGEELFEIKNANNSKAFDKNTAWLYVNDPKSPDYCRVFKNAN